MKIGYARVSTDDQNTDLQYDAFQKAGVDTIFADKASGADRDRPELAKCLASLKPGDTLIVWKLDRLARSLSHLIEIIDDLHQRNVEFVSITDVIDTRTAMGRAMFQITGVFAELERNVIRERTKAGMAAAKARGVKVGRHTSIPEDVAKRVIQLHAEGHSTRAIEEHMTGLGTPVSRSSVSRLTKNDGSAK